MSTPWDALPGWAQQLGTLVGAGGGSVVVLKLIEKFFARDDRQAIDRTSISTELRQDIRDLKKDIERLETLRDADRAARDALVTECAELRASLREMRAENLGLRERYHEFRGFVGVLVGTIEIYHTKLGLPENERIEVPDWVYRTVPGPTERQKPAGAQP